MVKYILIYILIFFVMINCTQKKYYPVEVTSTSWTLLDISLKKEKILKGCDEYERNFPYPSIFFDSNYKEYFITNCDRTIVKGKYEFYSNKDSLKLYKSTYPIFDGKYSFKLKTHQQNPYVKEYFIDIVSDSTYIYANLSVLQNPR